MGKVNTQLGYLYDASGNAAKDRKKRKKEDEDYKKRYKKAAKQPVMANDALKVHYDSKKFEGKRGTIGGDSSYKWDNNLLKDLPIRKYGRSYSDKFNKLAEENGIPKGDRAGFMKYLDSVEEGVGNEVSSIKKSVDERTKQKMKSNRERRIEEQKQAAIKKEQRKTDKKPKESVKQNDSVVDDVKDLASSFGKFVKGIATGNLDSATKDMAKTNEKLSNTSKEVQRGSRRAVNAATLGASSALDRKQGADDYTNKRKVGKGGGTDIVSDIAGSLVPGVLATKAVRGIQGANKALTALRVAGGGKKVAADVLEGAASGLLTSAAQSGVKATTDREHFNMKDELKNAAVNVGAGAVLDTVMSTVGPQAVKVLKELGDKSGAKLNNLRKDQVSNLTKYLKENEGNITKSELQKVIDNSHTQLPAPKNNGDLLPTVQNGTEKPKFRDASQPSQTTKTSDNRITALLDAPDNLDITKASDRELIDWVKRNPTRSDVYVRDEMQKRYQKLASEVDGLDNKDSDIYKQMEQALQKDGNAAELSGYNEYFQKKTSLVGKLEAHSKAEETWKTAKEVQAMYKEKPDWARFKIPDGMDADFKDQIPKRFLQPKSQTGGLDLYQAADAGGFESVDEFIDYLKFVDDNLKVKRKDLPILKAGEVKDSMKSLDDSENFLNTAVKNYGGYDSRNADMRDMLKSMTFDPQQYDVGVAPPMKKVQTLSDTEMNPTLRAMNIESAPKERGFTLGEGTDPTVPNESYDAMLQKMGLTRNPYTGKPMNPKTNREVDLETGRELTPEGIPIEKEPLQPTMGKRNPTHTVDPDGSPNSFTAPPKEPMVEEAPPTTNDELLARQKAEVAAVDQDSFVDPDMQIEAKRTEALSFFNLTPEKKAPDLMKYMIGDKTPVAKVRVGLAKTYQNYVDSNHVVDILENSIIKKSIKTLESGDVSPTNAAKLEDLRYYKDIIGRGTGYAKMALVNEGAASQKAVSQMSGYAKSLQDIVDASNGEVSLQDLIENRMVNRILWLRENKGESWSLPEYDSLIAKVQSKQHPAFEESNALFNNIQKEMLDQHQKYGLIADEEVEALSKEPFYIPLERDKSWLRNNSITTQKQEQKESFFDAILGRNPMPQGIQKMDDVRRVSPEITPMENGNTLEFFRNPLEVLAERVGGIHNSGLKNDTHKQIKRLVELSNDYTDTPIGHTLSVDEFNKVRGTAQEKATGGFLEVIEDGKKSYISLPKELMDVLQSNDVYDPINILQTMTSVVSGLKVRSIEYQMTAILRDLPQAFLNSQTANPIRYGKAAIQSLLEGRRQADLDGITFDRAYNPQDAGNMASSMKTDILSQLKRQEQGTKESFKGVKAVRKALDFITKPTTVLGETIDRLPRQTEYKLSNQRYAKIEQNLTKELEQTKTQLAKAPDDKAREDLQMRILTMQHRLDNLENDKQREATFRARDVMNYSRHGAGKASKAIKKYVNFANTTTQSKDKMARSLIEHPVKTVAKIASIATPVIAIQAQMYDNLDDSDKYMYDTIPAYYKQTNTILPLGNAKYVSIPKSQEVAIITNMMEADMGLMDGIDAASYAVKEVTPYQLGGVSQAMVPNDDGTVSFVDSVTLPSTFAEPLVDVVANSKMSFNRKPVVYDKKKSSTYVSPAIDSLPKVGGKPAADQLEYLVRQYGGDYSKYALAGLDSLLVGNTDRLSSLNPLQDRYKRTDSKVFKAMNYDKEKQKNK